MRNSEAIWVDSKQYWQCQVQQDGQRKGFYSSVKGRKGKLDAERRADEWLRTRSVVPTAKVGELFKLYEDYMLVNHKQQGQKIQRVGKNYILPALEWKKIAGVRKNDWQRIINNAAVAGVSGKPLSRKTLDGLRGVIVSFLHWLYDEYGYKLDIPALKIPESAEVGEIVILQPEDVKILFEEDCIVHYGERVRCHYINMWRWLVATGMRPGEALGLKKTDIEGDMISVRQSINVDGDITTGKNRNARRKVYISSTMQEILDDQQRYINSLGIITEWIFPERDGAPGNEHSSYKTWVAYRTQHGLSKSSLYGMRHTMAAYATNVPEAVLKKIIGHSSSMSTFATYQNHAVSGEQAEAMHAIDGVLARVRGKK